MLRESFEDVTGSHGNENEAEKIERDPRLVELWNKYKFLGDPPVKGSPVEQRLFATCERYSAYDLGDGTRPAEVAEDGENYFAPKKRELRPSDSSRRELHNQIALMTTGRQRSKMDEKRAMQIADFACEFVHGHTLAEMTKL